MTTERATQRPLRGWLVLALRLIVGVVFIYASIDKIIHPDRFAEIVWDFDLLPRSLVNPFSVCLPWIELVMGIAWPSDTPCRRVPRTSTAGASVPSRRGLRRPGAFCGVMRYSWWQPCCSSV